MSQHVILNAFLMTHGHHEASWRASTAGPGATTDVAHFVDLARRAEEAKLDSVFFADIPAVTGAPERNVVDSLDPVLLLTAIAGATSHIGLIATASTTFTEPYNLARSFATVDHLSGGRAGWNMVTTASAQAAGNYGLAEFPDAEERYARGNEYLEVVTKLWDSWEDDAVVGDVAGGRFADGSRIHPVEHRGEFYSVSGPLNVRRSPQGRPVQVQAGSSDPGIDLAGHYAEAVFTAQRDRGEAVRFARRVRDAAQKWGRSRDSVKILPGLVPFVRESEAQARRAWEEIDDLIVPELAKLTLAGQLQIDPDRLELDERLPWDVIGDPDKFSGKVSRADLILRLAREEDLTVRQLIRRLGGGRGHNIQAGTPEQIADYIEEWFRSGAADGFNVMPPVYPQELDAFTSTVVPILQERGLFRTEYSGRTLRENYGLERPASRYARQSAEALGA